MARVIRARLQGPMLVRAQVHDARAQATQIVEAAHAQAAALRASALDEARVLARAEVAQVLLEGARARDQAVTEVARAALQAALQVAERIVGEALDSKPQRIIEMLVPLLARVRRARSVVVRVHAEDAHVLRAALATLIARVGLEGTLEIAHDPGITRGGCSVESNIGEIDARIETRICELGRALGQDTTRATS